jgi:hypothetical protein
MRTKQDTREIKAMITGIFIGGIGATIIVTLIFMPLISR